MKTVIIAKASTQIHAPLSKVWEALTNPAIIKQYFFGTNTHTDWKVGSPITFTGEWQGKTYEDKGKVLEFIPNEKISYTYWSSMSGMEDKPENYVIVNYFVADSGSGKTTVTITQENIPDEKMREHSEENWKTVLRSMKDLLEQKELTI